MTEEAATLVHEEEKEEKEYDQHDDTMDDSDDVKNDEHLDSGNAQKSNVFGIHGGDPRSLDLDRCLLLSNVPSVLLNDPFDVFSNCMLDWVAQDFKVARDTIEKVIRIPKLQTDAENPELALRAIISFKSRVHKHRVFAQKNLAAESSIKLGVLESIPRDFVELEEDLEMADEVDGDDECAEEHNELNERNEPEPTVKSTEGEETSSCHADESALESSKDAQNGAENGNEQSSEKRSKRKEYVDDDLKVPFEISWEGAPEFQWKLCHTAADTRRLIIENILWADLQNIFIYRVMLKAETVDISFPMRFNVEGTKEMHGKMTLTFQWSMQIMSEAMRHLIYVRCPQGRRIKIFLPQTPAAIKLKEEFESKLGRVIQPTPRMYQLVIKILPSDYELTLEEAQALFAPQIPTEVENVKDEMDQPCALVTMASVDDTIRAHSSNSFVTLKREGEKDYKCHVFLRGVEAHFGSLLTRWDRKKIALDSAKKSAKRSAADESKPSADSQSAKKSRGSSRGNTHRSGRNYSSKGSYRGERAGSYSYGYGAGAPYDSRYPVDARSHAEQMEIEFQERILRQQEMLENMAAKIREQERLAGYGYYPGRSSYGASASSYAPSYGRSNYNSYDRRRSGRY